MATDDGDILRAGFLWSDGFSITPSDTTDLSTPALGIWVGTSGDVAVITKRGNTVIYRSVPVGPLPIIARRVLATNTTASNLVGGRL